jgi:hypothetical protein
MAKDSYNDLIFQLGDLAREQLVNKPHCPQSMERVYEAEDALVAQREALEELERQMNDEDAAYQEYLEQVQQEKARQQALVTKFRTAVAGIEGKVKELRKKVVTMNADVRYGKENLKKQEERQRLMEEGQKDPQLIAIGRENIKKVRLALLRKEREAEDAQRDVDNALTPTPGQPGAAGILAHKRMLELEDEVEQRKADHEAVMAELDRAIAEKEQDVQAAEDYLDQALFLLGEDCYTQRLADPALASFYPRLDKAP